MPGAKYIFDKGVMKLNPAYTPDSKDEKLPPTKPSPSLAVISSIADISAASAAQEKETKHPMQLAESTTASMEMLQDPRYLQKFKTSTPEMADNF